MVCFCEENSTQLQCLINLLETRTGLFAYVKMKKNKNVDAQIIGHRNGNTASADVPRKTGV